MVMDQQDTISQIICSLRNHKTANKHLSKQLISERKKYDQIISDLMDNIEYKSAEINKLSQNISSLKSTMDEQELSKAMRNKSNEDEKALLCRSIMLKCKEMKRPIQGIKECLTNQVKFIENDFDELWRHFKVHKIENDKHRQTEQAAIDELNGLCIAQNQIIGKLHKKLRRNKDNQYDEAYVSALLHKIELDTRTKLEMGKKIKCTKQKISKCRNDFDEIKGIWKEQSCEMQNDYQQMAKFINRSLQNSENRKTEIFETQQSKLQQFEREVQRLSDIEIKYTDDKLKFDVLSKQNEALCEELEQQKIDSLIKENEMKRMYNAQIEKYENKIKELKQQQNENSEKKHKNIQIATEILNILNAEDIDLKIQTLKNLIDSISKTQNIDSNTPRSESLQMQFYDLCNKAMLKLLNEQKITKIEQKNEESWRQKYKIDITFINGILENKERSIIEIKRQLRSLADSVENTKTITMMQAKLQILSKHCSESMDLSECTADEYTACMKQLATLNRKLCDVGSLIPSCPRESRGSMSMPSSPRKSKKSVSSGPRESRLHLPIHLQTGPKQRSIHLFNHLKRVLSAEPAKIRSASFEIVELIRKEGAVMNPMEYSQSMDDFGNTLLHKALNIAAMDIVRELLSHSADVNVQNIYGDSVIHDLCSKMHSHRMFVELFQFMIESKVKCDFKLLNNENKRCLDNIKSTPYAVLHKEVLCILRDATKNANIEFGIEHLRKIIDQNQPKKMRCTL